MRSAASNGNASKSRPGETDPDLICQLAPQDVLHRSYPERLS